MRCSKCNHRKAQMSLAKRLPDDAKQPDFYRHLWKCSRCNGERVMYQRKPDTMTDADAFLAQHGFDSKGNDTLTS